MSYLYPTIVQMLKSTISYALTNLFSIAGKSSPLVHTDKSTGLLKAKPGSHMLHADGTQGVVPAHNFIHPQTGKVLPIQGNVAFDPLTSRLVFVVDSATGLFLAIVCCFIGVIRFFLELSVVL